MSNIKEYVKYLANYNFKVSSEVFFGEYTMKQSRE